MTTRLVMTAGGCKIPSGRTVRGRIKPPPSKSITQRAFNLALLAGGRFEIEGPLRSEDTDRYLGAFRSLGWVCRETGECFVLEAQDPVVEAPIYCGHNGTMLRFLTASLTTIEGEWTLDGSPRLRQRPIGPLVESLRSLGARIRYLENEGFAPIAIAGGILEGGSVHLDGSQSSQFVSALLMAATQADGEVVIKAENLVSGPYVELTRQVMGSFGADIEQDAETRSLRVRPTAIDCPAFTVEGDFSSAAYPAAAAILTGGAVSIEGVAPDSQQGDRRFLDLLRSMGAQVEWLESKVEVRSGRELRGVEVDMAEMPDQVPTLAALAPFARGRTVIENVGHLRIKESDRLATMARELGRLGASVLEKENGLEIEGSWAGDLASPENEVTVETHGDHRVAMSLALCGLVRSGVTIGNPEVVAKSYPSFWSDLEILLQA